MAVLTVYVYCGLKHNRISVLTVYDWPTDWPDLKRLMGEAFIKLHFEHQITAALATLELHLPGRFVWKTKTGAYSPRRIRFRREVEWSGNVSFNPQTEELTLTECRFGPHLYKVLASDYYAERGMQFHVANLIPRAHEDISNLKLLLMEPSGNRYVDYTEKPRDLYDLEAQQPKKRQLYASTHVRGYLPAGAQIREDTEAEEKP